MSQKLNGTICTHLSHFITHFKLYYWLKKYQNKAIRVYYTNEHESKKSTSSPTFIYLKGHNPPYHTRQCLSYIKGKYSPSIYEKATKWFYDYIISQLPYVFPQVAYRPTSGPCHKYVFLSEVSYAGEEHGGRRLLLEKIRANCLVLAHYYCNYIVSLFFTASNLVANAARHYLLTWGLATQTIESCSHPPMLIAGEMMQLIYAIPVFCMSFWFHSIAICLSERYGLWRGLQH